MLQCVPLSGLWATLWAKPMEPQSVISPAKPSYAPSEPKPMRWGAPHRRRWFRMLVEKMRRNVSVCVSLCLSESALADLLIQRLICNLISHCPPLIYTHPCHHHMPRFERSDNGLPGLKSNEITVMHTGAPSRALQISFTPSGPYCIRIPWP